MIDALVRLSVSDAPVGQMWCRKGWAAPSNGILHAQAELHTTAPPGCLFCEWRGCLVQAGALSMRSR